MPPKAAQTWELYDQFIVCHDYVITVNTPSCQMSQIIWNIQNHTVIKVAITNQIGCSSTVIQLGDDGTSVKHSTENKNHTPKYQYCIDQICMYQFRKTVIEFTWYNIVFWSSIKVDYDRNAIYLFTDCKLFINIYHWSRLLAIFPMIEAADNHFSFPATMFGFFMDGNVINRKVCLSLKRDCLHIHMMK